MIEYPSFNSKSDIDIYFASKEFRNRNNQQAQSKTSIVYKSTNHGTYIRLVDSKSVALPFGADWTQLTQPEWERRMSKLVQSIAMTKPKKVNHKDI